MGKLLLKAHKHLLYIIKRENKEFIRFNLKTQMMEKRYRGKGEWREVAYQYGFFKHLSIRDIEADEKFIKLIELVQKYNENCSNLSTFFNRLSEVMVYENFINEDVKFRVDSKWNYGGRGYSYYHLKKPLHKYDKHTIKLLKESRFEVNSDFENKYFEENEGEKTFFRKMLIHIHGLDCNSRQKYDVLYALLNRDYKVKRLVDDYGYDAKAMFRFVLEYLGPFENLDVNESITLLDDYYTMASEVGRKVKKYPKYLKSMHDIIKANYESFKREYDENQFAEIYEEVKEILDYKDKEHCIVLPKSSKDIVSEGVDLNHCVSSYVDKILEKRTIIIFLRKLKEPEDSLVTVEYQDGKITQARGSYNRNLEPVEKEFLKKFCDKKKLQLEIEV